MYIDGIAYDHRFDAQCAKIEGFLWAGGANTPDEVGRILSTEDDAGEQDTALNLAHELVNEVGGHLTISTGENEEMDAVEWAAVIRRIVGVKYADPEEDARLIWDEDDAREIERADDSLVIRSQ